MPNYEQIISQLRQERNRIDQAISALESLSSSDSGSVPSPGRQKRRRLSAAARRRIAEAQRKRWAKVRAAKK